MSADFTTVVMVSTKSNIVDSGGFKNREVAETIPRGQVPRRSQAVVYWLLHDILEMDLTSQPIQLI